MHHRASHTRTTPRCYGSTIGSRSSSHPAMPSTLHGEGGHTARCILSHGQSVLSRSDAVCHDVYKHIARVAHPDKNPVRNAYHCAVAGVIMDTIQRAYGMVVSSSSSDRSAFLLLPALDSEQFEDMVDAHRPAKISHTPPLRSPVTPVARGSVTPATTGNCPLAVPHNSPFPLPGFGDPPSPEPRAFSATDALPDDNPARVRFESLGHRGR